MEFHDRINLNAVWSQEHTYRKGGVCGVFFSFLNLRMSASSQLLATVIISDNTERVYVLKGGIDPDANLTPIAKAKY